MRLAHISDLHFSKLSMNPSQFFSKRWLGNLNLLVSRKKIFSHDQLYILPEFFKEKGITHVLISGDFSTTSLKKEFIQASSFVHSLERNALKVFTLPGNHDHYTKRAYKKRLFYDFFPAQFSIQSDFNLKDHKITLVPLSNRVWLIILDTTISTSLVSSQGFFSLNLEKNLEKVLSSIPKEDKIIIANHYPLFHNDGFKNGLRRVEALRTIISQFHNIKLYLHGHSHRQCVADLRESRLPIILDPGSTTHKKNGGLHILELNNNDCIVQVYNFENKWTLNSEKQFKL